MSITGPLVIHYPRNGMEWNRPGKGRTGARARLLTRKHSYVDVCATITVGLHKPLWASILAVGSGRTLATPGSRCRRFAHLAFSFERIVLLRARQWVADRDGSGRRGRTLPRCKAPAPRPRPRPPQPPRALLRAPPPPPNRQRLAAALPLLLDLSAAAVRSRRIHGRAAPGLPHQRRHLPRRPIPHQGKRGPSLEHDPAPLPHAPALGIVLPGFVLTINDTILLFSRFSRLLGSTFLARGRCLR